MMFHEIKKPSERIATKANVGFSFNPDERAEISALIKNAKRVNVGLYDPDTKAEVSVDQQH